MPARTIDQLLIVHSPIAGAAEKIALLHQRHARLASCIEHYEKRVAEQAAHLKRMNRLRDFDDNDDDEEEQGAAAQELPEPVPMTVEDMRLEEEEIRELERKKQGLEQRVKGLGKDITGVLG